MCISNCELPNTCTHYISNMVLASFSVLTTKVPPNNLRALCQMDPWWHIKQVDGNSQAVGVWNGCNNFHFFLGVCLIFCSVTVWLVSVMKSLCCGLSFLQRRRYCYKATNLAFVCSPLPPKFLSCFQKMASIKRRGTSCCHHGFTLALEVTLASNSSPLHYLEN